MSYSFTFERIFVETVLDIPYLIANISWIYLSSFAIIFHCAACTPQRKWLYYLPIDVFITQIWASLFWVELLGTRRQRLRNGQPSRTKKPLLSTFCVHLVYAVRMKCPCRRYMPV